MSACRTVEAGRRRGLLHKLCADNIKECTYQPLSYMLRIAVRLKGADENVVNWNDDTDGLEAERLEDLNERDKATLPDATSCTAKR